MRLAHNIRISVYCKQEEDCEQVKNTLIGLIPFNLEEEKISFKEILVKGENGYEHDIRIYEVLLTKEKHVKAFLDLLNERLSAEQKELLIKQSYTRFDKELNFFLRIDKERLVKDKIYWITDSGNCFHIRISIAAYPKRYETATAMVKQIFS